MRYVACVAINNTNRLLQIAQEFSFKRTRTDYGEKIDGDFWTNVLVLGTKQFKMTISVTS